MKRGLIGPYQLGTLRGIAKAFEIAEEITSQRGVDVESIFFASAFQAGIDQFLVADFKGRPLPKSRFLQARTKAWRDDAAFERARDVQRFFSDSLPENWEEMEEYNCVDSLIAFLADLFDAMELGAAVLAPWGVPDVAEAQARLPAELSVPLSNLLSAIEPFQTPSPIPQLAVLSEHVGRLEEIISGGLFCKYSAAHSHLEEEQAPPETVLAHVTEVGRQLFLENKNQLAIKRSAGGLLQVTPKLIDAAFGKLPGALSEAAAVLGIRMLEERRRIVIYDFRGTAEHLFLSNIVRMFKPADEEIC